LSQKGQLYYTDILNRNAGSKFLSNSLALSIYRIVKKDGSEKGRRYLKEVRKLLNCSSELKRDEENGKYIRHYCKSRFCIICNRNRAGDLINKFTTKIEGQENKKMITLSIKNPTGEGLKQGVTLMYNTFYNLRKNLERTFKIKIDYIRKLEITENERKKSFHPHFHFIINEKNIDIEKRGKKFLKLSDLILDEWLHRLPAVTDKQGQDITDWKEGGAKEIFKYFTKIVTKDRKKSTPEKAVYKFLRPQTFRNFYDAIEGRRIFEKAGIYRKSDVDLTKIDYSYTHLMIMRNNDKLNWYKFQTAKEFKYIHNNQNYFDFETGEGVTNYQARSDLIDSLKNYSYTVYFDADYNLPLQFLPPAKESLNINTNFENQREENYIDIEIRRLKEVIKAHEEKQAGKEIIRYFKDKLAVLQFMKLYPLKPEPQNQIVNISRSIVESKKEKLCYTNKRNGLCN